MSGEKESRTLSARETLCFSFGDLGYQTTYYWVSAFLMIFYTDVFLIPSAAVSVLMLVVRLYDAVNDPVLGSLMDRTKSKMGRYRPWVLAGGLGLAISIVFMFWAHPDWATTAKIIYMYITYILVVTFSTMFYMAYMSLNGCISSSSEDRASASGARMAMSYLGMLLVGYIAPYVIEYFSSESAVEGYLTSMIIFAVISLPFIGLAGFGTKERVGAHASSKIPMKQQVNALIRNMPMMLLLFCMTAHGVQMNGRLTMITYYCTYVAKSTTVLAVFNLLNSLFAIFGSIIAPFIFKLTGHKGKTSSAVLYICAASMIGQYFATAPSALFYILVSLTGFCYGAFSALLFSMIPDAVDYAQYRHGVRVDGFLNAIASFGFKIGGAVSTSVAMAIITATGYVANEAQNAQTLTAMNALLNLMPAALCFLAGTFLLFYRLDRKTHQGIVKELEERNAI